MQVDGYEIDAADVEQDPAVTLGEASRVEELARILRFTIKKHDELRRAVRDLVAGAEPIGDQRDIVGDWAVNGHALARLRTLVGGK